MLKEITNSTNFEESLKNKKNNFRSLSTKISIRIIQINILNKINEI